MKRTFAQVAATILLYSLAVDGVAKATSSTPTSELSKAFVDRNPIVLVDADLELLIIDPCPATDDADSDRLSRCDELELGTSPAKKDTDGDGLSDGDEVLGTTGGLDLAALGALPLKKDLLFQVDWLVDSNEYSDDINTACPVGTSHSHAPNPGELNRIVAMFADAPVYNPDGSTGINIIFSVSPQAVPDLYGIDDGEIETGSKYYDSHFSPNRIGYFRHVVLAHRVSSRGIYAAGWGGGVQAWLGSQCGYASALILAHEIGHTLGLSHGGDVDCHGKPNYNSIMNSRYYGGVTLNCVPTSTYTSTGAVLDFSSGQLASLDEADLDEFAGICDGVDVDWDNDGVLESSVMVNFNAPQLTAQCGGEYTVLDDHDDWGNIRYAPLGSSARGDSKFAECDFH